MRPFICTHIINICAGTRRIDVSWTTPDTVNGIIERYIVYMSMDEASLPGDIVYNSTDISVQLYSNDSLLAGTTYFVTLAVS